MIKYINRIKFMDHLIKRKATGNLETFARKNRISKSTLSEIIQEMKELGFPIKYDRTRNTYYYEQDGEMIKCLFLKYGEVLTRNETQKIGKDEELCFSKTAIFELCQNS